MSIVEEIMDKLYRKAEEFDGAVSGEHGIGHAKKVYLRNSVGEEQIRLMSQIKQIFDPNHILNPGKIFD
jgi:glycolate oxidase